MVSAAFLVALLSHTSPAPRLVVQSGHSDHISAIAFSPDQKLLITGSWDSTAAIWELTSGRQIHRLVSHTRTVRVATFSPDVTLVATGGDDKTVRVWETRSGRELHRLTGHTGKVISAAFSSDGKK